MPDSRGEVDDTPAYAPSTSTSPHALCPPDGNDRSTRHASPSPDLRRQPSQTPLGLSNVAIERMRGPSAAMIPPSAIEPLPLSLPLRYDTPIPDLVDGSADELGIESKTIDAPLPSRRMEGEDEGGTSEAASPTSLSGPRAAGNLQQNSGGGRSSVLCGERAASTDSYIGPSLCMNEFSNVRLHPSSPSTFLRAGTQFRGTQQSERQVYEVQVDIKHVDMRESFLCGYLRIQGLTDEHPTLTTYFEGEIIGTKYSFLTRHEGWGSSDKVDLAHWKKFQAFSTGGYARKAGKPSMQISNLLQRENIFMRWKEQFLVPDHRVRTISGASFEGFYYICFNRLEGSVSGIYFHAKSEKFQQLELKHVPNSGCFGAFEFR